MRKLLVGHSCTTAQKRGWNAVRNGDLIRLAEAEFDLFITCDQNIRYQQNLAARRIAILELTSNDLHRILSAGSDICAAMAAIQPGEYMHLSIP